MVTAHVLTSQSPLTTIQKVVMNDTDPSHLESEMIGQFEIGILQIFGDLSS